MGKPVKPKLAVPITAWKPTIGDIDGKHYVSQQAFRQEARENRHL